eukprot:scaffold53334_cov48-Phaeocystis_antarctica.AAC.1
MACHLKLLAAARRQPRPALPRREDTGRETETRERERSCPAGQEAALREALALSVEVTVSRVCPV